MAELFWEELIALVYRTLRGAFRLARRRMSAPVSGSSGRAGDPANSNPESQPGTRAFHTLPDRTLSES